MKQSSDKKPSWPCLSLIVLLLWHSSAASLPEPSIRLYGAIAIDTKIVEAANDVDIVARANGVLHPIGAYQMGDNPDATGACTDGADCYELRIKIESLEHGGTQSDDAALIGQTVKIYIQQDGGPEEYVTEIIADRAVIMELNLNLCHHFEADYDCDTDIDLDDFAVFADCRSGPGVAPTPILPEVTPAFCLSAFDDDDDGDVDTQDFATFQSAFTGAGQGLQQPNPPGDSVGRLPDDKNEGQTAASGASARAESMGAGGIDIPPGIPTPIGFLGMTGQAIVNVAEAYPGIASIWTYSFAEDAWHTYARDGPAFLTTLAQLLPGHAYWIVADAPVTITVPAPGDTSYYHNDHIGSTNVVTDTGGTLVHESYNYAFGSMRYEHNTGDDFDPLYQFTGKERDDESGLHYFEARFYGSAIGRFLSVDPVQNLVTAPSPGKPAYAHAYAYALSRPLQVVDPSGMVPQVREYKNEIVWSDEVIIWGSAASQAEAATIESNINSTWNAQTLQFNGKPVRFDVSVRYVNYQGTPIQGVVSGETLRYPKGLSNPDQAQILEVRDSKVYITPGAVWNDGKIVVRSGNTEGDKSPLERRFGFVEQGAGAESGELGHLWGLQHRDNQPTNIMCHDPRRCGDHLTLQVDQSTIDDLFANFESSGGTIENVNAPTSAEITFTTKQRTND